MDLIEVARMEERRQAIGLGEVAPERRAFAGGTAGRGEPGSWINSVVGAGMNGPVEAGELDELIAWYSDVGIEPRIECSPFADESFLKLLGERRFVVRMFENVFFRTLDGESPGGVRPVHDEPRGVSVGVVDPADAAQVRAAASVAMSGFFPPGTAPKESDFAVSERIMRHPRTVTVVARADGAVVGAGSMEVSGRAAGLFGLSVLEPYRRRGIQQMLIAARLNEAARRGATLATIGSKPGIATERNVRRMGFQLAYTKPVLVQPGPGRVPVLA